MCRSNFNIIGLDDKGSETFRFWHDTKTACATGDIFNLGKQKVDFEAHFDVPEDQAASTVKIVFEPHDRETNSALQRVAENRFGL